MYKVGDIYVNPITERKYECIANITSTPTIFNKSGIKHQIFDDVTHEVCGDGSPAKTIVLRDENGNEFVAVLVDEEVDFTATADDIREGKVAATDDGVTVGEKYIPTYMATQGYAIVMPGETFSVKLPVNNLYDYTKFQAAICTFNTTLANSVSCEKIALNDNVYNVLSTVSVSEIQLNHETKTIELGFMNDTNLRYLIRSFTFKEV